MVSNTNKPWCAPFPKGTEYLGRHLRQAGYQNGYAGKWHLLGNPKTLAVGKDGDTNDKTIAARFAKFMTQREDPKKPWFFQAHFLNPHDIYDFGRLFEGQAPKKTPTPEQVKHLAHYKEEAENFLATHPDLELPPGWDAKIRDLPEPSGDWAHPFGNDGRYEKMSKEEQVRYWQKYKALYYVLHEEVDRDIGDMLDVLRKDHPKEMDNTVIIWTSDHGDLCGDHESLKYKGPLPFDSQIHIPFMISGPGIPQGERRNQLASQIDLPATLCELAGTKAPNAGRAGAISFLPLIHNDSLPGRSVIYSEYYYLGAVQPLRIIRNHDFKYCEHLAEQKNMLFDLKKDPWERENVAGLPAYTAVEARLREQLHRWQKETGDPISADCLTHEPWARWPKKKS